MLNKVDALTRQYRDSIIKPNGSISLNGDSVKYLIDRNVIQDDVISDLDIFADLAPFIIRTEIFPNHTLLNVGSFMDFYDRWAFKTISFFCTRRPIKTQQGDVDLSDYLNLQLFANLLFCKKDLDANYTFELSQGNLKPLREKSKKLNLQLLEEQDPNKVQSIMSEIVEISEALTPPSSKLRNSSVGLVIDKADNKLASCFVFPLLEGLIRKECKNFLDANGMVVNASSLPAQLSGKYLAFERARGQARMSDIGDELLLLFLTNQGKLGNRINAILEEFKSCLNSQMDAYRLFADARNSVLHGKITLRGLIVGKYLIFSFFLSRISGAEYVANLQNIKKWQGWLY